MVFFAIINQAVNDAAAEEAGQAAFFGFIGIASALVFASKYICSYSELMS